MNEKLVIVDVGCSNGMALTWCKDCLSSRDIKIHAVGIDPYAKEASKSNLDEFICGDATKATHYIGKADIVICIHVLNRIKLNPKTIFQDAVKLLKNGGIMITDAHRIPLEYKDELNPLSDFKRIRLCCSKYAVRNLLSCGMKMDVYEKR